MDFPGGSVVKNLPAEQEMQVRSLEMETATHSSILAEIILWTEEPGGLQFKYSCWNNPMDRGAWWATVHGVAKKLDTT